MSKQLQYSVLPVDVYIDHENEATENCFYSEMDFSSKRSDNEFVNEILFIGNIHSHFSLN